MPSRRSRFSLSQPRIPTFVLSLVLILIALASAHLHLPMGQGFVAAHRSEILVAGYVVLVLGVLFPGL